MTPDQLLELARQLIDQGKERGITIRLLGSLGARMQSPEAAILLDRLGREPTHDIDFMGYSTHHAGYDRMFKELGYVTDEAVAYSQEYGLKRLIYYEHAAGIMVEIFLDQLRMAHTVDFRGRLELKDCSVTLTDLVLSKLQIQEISEKDLKDMIALLATVELGTDSSKNVIDTDYVADVMRRDWGFYYTARGNLVKVQDLADRLGNQLTDHERETAKARAKDLISDLDVAPKSLSWRLRSVIGPRMKWYEDVQDVHR
jgi:hypothetical protein